MRNKRIVLIGAGNVAHALAPALLKAGLNLCQIYSHTVESARELGMKTGITYTSETYAIYPDGDIYIFCVSDDALPSLISLIAKIIGISSIFQIFISRIKMNLIKNRFMMYALSVR